MINFLSHTIYIITPYYLYFWATILLIQMPKSKSTVNNFMIWQKLLTVEKKTKWFNMEKWRSIKQASERAEILRKWIMFKMFCTNSSIRWYYFRDFFFDLLEAFGWSWVVAFCDPLLDELEIPWLDFVLGPLSEETLVAVVAVSCFSLTTDPWEPLTWLLLSFLLGL